MYYYMLERSPVNKMVIVCIPYTWQPNAVCMWYLTWLRGCVCARVCVGERECVCVCVVAKRRFVF